MKDEIFKKPLEKQFEFDENVASVFDDMISRSVPFYDVSTKLVCEILYKHLLENAKIVDLGCSTGNTLFKLFEINSKFELTGVDESKPMLDIANSKARAFGASIDFIQDDILKFNLERVDAVILNYTLQFIRPLKRSDFVKRIYSGLKDGGVFVFSEKIIYEDKKLGKDIIEIYENYKIEKGYSRYEVSQKRQALENILIPFSEDENKTMILEAGFKFVETVFKWGNFATFIAIK
ncbi:carboxy-S-adenosyl-L-methionine synthase [Campylobacter blaseri]|uniref:Carboxy-S-adenosyl-L-methionine synthase n=1 Tax=Campylobacter blaseri TaxID=2042961 RepID=A0A2P8R231_9BACT|nr:carboxy-S-adenosyl-L-methionine synthase CmoA [Campylobacter blaseri]PSM52552.1 carboxy-S-adenosyl-L-methionine synthase CmoA [Campylobacter blaseri]PSM54200.1 carboxy-S-adenosyl-L-methionine synthase CmoA [Campylobacter blaseri]QKF85851.1 carboxy-S-adenosyl-L-methionine synthase [Campylobacter blaseri]